MTVFEIQPCAPPSELGLLNTLSSVYDYIGNSFATTAIFYMSILPMQLRGRKLS